MAEKEALDLSEIMAADDTEFEFVKAYGIEVKIGQLSSGDMMDWLEYQSKPETMNIAGIYLLVMSLVGKNGERVAKEERAATVEVFRNKNAASNRKVIRAARKLNGLDDIVKTLGALKNDSGGANTGASPSGSDSQSAG